MPATRRRGARRAAVRPSSPNSRSRSGFRRAGVEPARASRRAGVVAGLGWRPIAQERPEAGGRLVEPFPALLVRHADSLVVAFRRARADAGDHAPIGQHIQRGQRLRQGHRAAQRDQRDRCRELHGAGSFDHRGQRRQAVEPRCLKQEVVIGGDRCEAAVPRGVDRARQTTRATAPRRRTPSAASAIRVPNRADP